MDLESYKLLIDNSHFAGIKHALSFIRNVPWLNERLLSLGKFNNYKHVKRRASLFAYFLKPKNQALLDLNPINTSSKFSESLPEEFLDFLQICMEHHDPKYEWILGASNEEVLKKYRETFGGMSKDERDAFYAWLPWRLLEWILDMYNNVPKFIKEGFLDRVATKYFVHKQQKEWGGDIGKELSNFISPKTELAIFSTTFTKLKASSLKDFAMPLDLPGSNLRLFREARYLVNDNFYSATYIYALDGQWFGPPLNFEEHWTRIDRIHLAFEFFYGIPILIYYFLRGLRWLPIITVFDVITRGYYNSWILYGFFSSFIIFHVSVHLGRLSNFTWTYWVTMMLFALGNSFFACRTFSKVCAGAYAAEGYSFPVKSARQVLFLACCILSAAWYPLFFILIKFTPLHNWFFYKLPQALLSDSINTSALGSCKSQEK